MEENFPSLHVLLFPSWKTWNQSVHGGRRWGKVDRGIGRSVLHCVALAPGKKMVPCDQGLEGDRVFTEWYPNAKQILGIWSNVGQKALTGFRWEQIVELNYLYWAANKKNKKTTNSEFSRNKLSLLSGWGENPICKQRASLHCYGTGLHFVSVLLFICSPLCIFCHVAYL